MGGIVSGVGSLLGGGSNNSQFHATGANIAQPTTTDQAQQAYTQAQTGLSQQQQLMNALAAQNGIQNQSNVFNQLQGVANGTGPNPAQAMLNQSTGQNVANQAALMAGQRGSGANAGLIARQAAQQGGALQQNAAGQAAIMQANQQLGALNQLGGLAGQQVNQQTNALNSYNQAAQGEQGQLLGGINAQNNANVSQQSNINNANAGMAQANAKNSGNFLSGAINGLGGAAAQSFLGGGGGGGASPLASADMSGGALTAGGGEAAAGGLGALGDAVMLAADGGMITKENPKLQQVPEAQRFSAKLPPHLQEVASLYHPHMMACGGAIKGEMYAAKGKVVPGKASVEGNSTKNDTVPALLSPGEVIIPRSVMQSDDPVGNAAKFVAALHNKNSSAKENPEEFKSALKRAISSRKKD